MKDEHPILIRLSGEEHEKLSTVALADGRPLASWARRQILAAADKPSDVAVDDEAARAARFTEEQATQKRERRAEQVKRAHAREKKKRGARR